MRYIVDNNDFRHSRADGCQKPVCMPAWYDLIVFSDDEPASARLYLLPGLLNRSDP